MKSDDRRWETSLTKGTTACTSQRAIRNNSYTPHELSLPEINKKQQRLYRLALNPIKRKRFSRTKISVATWFCQSICKIVSEPREPYSKHGRRHVKTSV